MKENRTKKLILEQLRKMPIIQISCEKCGISRASLYRWKQKDKNFAREIEKAIAEGETLINDMSETQLISLIRDKNFQAIHLWLKNHHKKYTDKIEVINRDGTGKLSRKQKSLLREALHLVPNEIITFKKNE